MYFRLYMPVCVQTPGRYIQFICAWLIATRKLQFAKEIIIDNRLPDALRYNKNITMLSLELLCNVLECSASDGLIFLDLNWKNAYAISE